MRVRTLRANVGVALRSPLGAQRPSLASVPFTAGMHEQLKQLGGIYNATDPDLSAFAANGGKLIIYHSWADQAIPPFASINYYRAVVRQAGGLAAAQAFSRLYMVPGLYHCHAASLSTATRRRPCSSCLSSSDGSSAEKPPRRSLCLSPRRPPG